MASNPQAQRRPYHAYQLGDLIFVPHYTLRGFFIRPGGELVIGLQLVEAGARRIELDLWERKYPAYPTL